MALIKCPECGKEISDKVKICPNCGYPNPGKNKKVISKTVFIKFVIIVAVLIGIIAAILALINSNPEKKYLSLFRSAKYEDATEFYKENIEGNSEMYSKIENTQKEEIDDIYNQYVEGKLDCKKAVEKISLYKNSDVVYEYYLQNKNKIERLDKSKKSFIDAQKYENENDTKRAIKKYKEVVEFDSNYDVAQKKISVLEEQYKTSILDEAKEYANNKEYDKAIEKINQVISVLGDSDDLMKLKSDYAELQSERYVSVKVIGKTVTHKDTSKWIFSNRINFEFSITNNSDKAIKGVEGVLTINDLFGKEIKQVICDFTGFLIEPGEIYVETNLGLECNQFMDEDMKIFNTDYEDLQFVYDVLSVVYEDGTRIEP